MKSLNSQTAENAFDSYAAEYDVALEKGISVSGEDKEFFARSRIEFLAKQLERHAFFPQKILDFGCGTGSAIPYLLQAFPNASIVCVDVSSKSIEIAKNLHKSDRVNFALSSEDWVDGRFDLVFCNGVFHHIPVQIRKDALSDIWNALVGSGFFSFWENNPWNPGTRIVMSRIPFDRDAQTISPYAAKQLLREANFHVIDIFSCFYFPRILSALRKYEKYLNKFPLGAQYLVLGKK